MEFKTIKALEPQEKFTTTKEIVDFDCKNCNYDRGILSYSTYASHGIVECQNPHCSNHKQF